MPTVLPFMPIVLRFMPTALPFGLSLSKALALRHQPFDKLRPFDRHPDARALRQAQGNG